MSSSRSIAAARSRRAGETQPPVSGGRPGTSIASHSAFVPTPNSNNVRVAKAPIQQQQQQQQSNNMPFSKLSISDAIGLITLRLGRIEQFVIDYDHNNHDGAQQNMGKIPENSKIIDNSVLTSMINRLDSLEKREATNTNTNTNSSSVNSEQLSKFEKELKDTKDLLSHFLFKFELFSKETNDKFIDIENAFSDIEKNILSAPLSVDDIISNINVIENDSKPESENENDNSNVVEIINASLHC
jgi:hypothetical protein